MKPVFSTSEPPYSRSLEETMGIRVRRIFCVGRNYVEHVLELGNKVEKKQPFYFTKSHFHYWVQKKPYLSSYDK